MFFIGILGVQSKEKEITDSAKIQCRECDKRLGGKLIKTYNFFHFFFIPLFKWGERYYLICNGCNSTYEIPKDKGKFIENGEDIEISYWDLKPVEKGTNHSVIYKCNHCGKEIKGDYRYCPYCGYEVR